MGLERSVLRVTYAREILKEQTLTTRNTECSNSLRAHTILINHCCILNSYNKIRIFYPVHISTFFVLKKLELWLRGISKGEYTHYNNVARIHPAFIYGSVRVMNHCASVCYLDTIRFLACFSLKPSTL